MPEPGAGEISSTVPLPRGCSEIKPSPTMARIGKFLHVSPIEYTPEERYEKWGLRGRFAKDIFQMVLKHDILDYSNKSIDQIDPETGLSIRTLLAQGLNDARNGVIPVITNNLVGIFFQADDEFCLGGELDLAIRYGNEFVGTRKAEGKFIGIVINIEKKFTRPIKNKDETRKIDADTIGDIYHAIISAKKQLERAKRDNVLSDYQTTQELNDAVNWVLFAKR